jgi:uncharacterized protein (DUF1015 family)
MHIKPFRASYPLFDRIPSPDTFCSQAKNAFLEYKQNALLARTEKRSLYIYQIELHHRLHTGIVALNDVQDFFTGHVKKHEKTLRARENRQMDLILRWGAILKPVLLTFPPVPALNAWLETYTGAHPPLLETYFRKDGQKQRLWVVSDPADIEHVQRLFEREVHDVYIADGHHRTSTVALLHQEHKLEYPALDFDHLFCAFFATDQLDILDYNRVVEGLNDLSPEQFFGRLAKVLDIELIANPRKPRKKHELKLFFRGHWYRLSWKPEILAAFRPGKRSFPVLLDVSLLNELVLQDILGIQDFRTSARISYVEGTKGLQGVRKAVKDAPDTLGFVLHAVSFEDMMCIADAGKVLPPKSTYFEPRMKSGMLIKLLEKE